MPSKINQKRKRDAKNVKARRALASKAGFTCVSIWLPKQCADAAKKTLAEKFGARSSPPTFEMLQAKMDEADGTSARQADHQSGATVSPTVHAKRAAAKLAPSAMIVGDTSPSKSVAAPLPLETKDKTVTRGKVKQGEFAWDEMSISADTKASKGAFEIGQIDPSGIASRSTKHEGAA